ncbi:MAG: IclR family transcriptional regulator [Rubrivivax sp.]|nr:IclR family transcriptional regulator [Rubrivivax sp.]
MNPTPAAIPSPSAPADEAPTPPVGVLERALCVLECFSGQQPRLQLRELAERTGLDKATLLRLLATFTRYGYVQRFSDGRYAPGPASLRLSGIYLSTFNLTDRLQPALASVMQHTGETVAFYIRSGEERVCLYRDNTPRGVAHHVEVGNRIPLADGGSSAHVLLAYTGDSSPAADEVRARGYWITRNERLPDLASVAVPVFEGDGRFLGALVVIGPSSRLTRATLTLAVDVARSALAAQGFATQPPRPDAPAPPPDAPRKRVR